MTIDARHAAGAVLLIVMCALPVRGQTVSEVLTFLVTNQSVQTGDFDRDRAAAEATSETISRVLLANLATLPVVSSSSAFVYRLNPELATEERATATFSPFLVERALTAGRHQASVGVTFQHLHFTSLDGRELRDGSLVTTANQFVDESQPFDVDRLTLNLDASIATLYANVGVTDRMELSVALPTITLQLDGTRANVYRGQALTQAAASATAVGLADMLVNAKYLLVEDGGARAAVAGVLRLPTGRRADLLGSGTASLRLSAIGSFDGRRASTHLNGGFTVGGLSNELSYGVAQALALTRQVTASVELLGRWIDDAGEIAVATSPHPRLAGVVTERLLSDKSAVNLISFVPGLKWNFGDTWVLATNVTVPLRRVGLVSPITPFIGVDFTFEP